MTAKHRVSPALFCILIFASGILFSWCPPSAFAGALTVSDSWSAVPKGIGGVFSDSTGQWSEFSMTDTDASGRQYIDMWLVPGAVVDFKAVYRPQATNKKYESDFPTSNGRRTLIVPSAATTIAMNWSDTPSVPTALLAYTDSAKVTLSWTAPTGDNSLDVVNGGGYRLYYDTGPVFDTWYLFRANDTIVGTSTVCTNLINDSVYFFSLRSFDAYWDTGPIFSGAFSESVQVRPGGYSNVLFRLFVGEMNDSNVYIAYDTGGGWTERPLAREGTTKWWSDTIPLYRGFPFKYKFAIVDTYSAKRYEFPVSNGRKHLFVYPNGPGINSMIVKGSWNWGASASMRLDKDGLWRADVNIPNAGIYEYGFSVNGSSWSNDPYNSVVRNNNSVLSIDATTNLSTMRELLIPDTLSVTAQADWEDTPYAPTDFMAMPNSGNSILLTWTPASQMEDLDSYRIEYSENPADTASWFQMVELPQDSSSFIAKNIIPGDTYYYRIYTVDFANNQSQSKNFSSSIAAQQRHLFFLIRNDDPMPIEDPLRIENRIGLVMLAKLE